MLDISSEAHFGGASSAMKAMPPNFRDEQSKSQILEKTQFDT
jgi:hypothetical protein